MLRTVGDLDQWKYVITDIQFAKKDSNEPLLLISKNIKSITIIHKYTENIVPVIHVTAAVEKALYKELTVSESLLTAKLTMYKFIQNSQTKARQMVMSKSFAVLNEKDFRPEEIRALYNEKATDETVDGSTPNQLMEASFFLIDKAALANYRKNMSISVGSASITDTLALAFSQRGYRQILMNKIPSEHRGNIFIPTCNLLATLEYLNNRYGIFDTDYLFYMDISTDKNYLLDKINVGRAVEDGQPSIVTMFLEEDGSAEATDAGSTMENNTFIVNIPSTPKVLKLDNYSEYVDGTSVIAVDSQHTVQSVKGDDNGMQKSVFVMNHKITKQLQHRSREFKHALGIDLYDIDIGMIGPNLLYKISAHPNFQKLNPINGDYRLDQAILTFNKSTDDGLSLVANLIFKRIVK